MLVDPATPRIEVVRPTLCCDGLESTDFDAIVHRNCHCSHFPCVWISVFQDHVAPALSIATISEITEDAHDFFT